MPGRKVVELREVSDAEAGGLAIPVVDVEDAEANLGGGGLREEP